MKKQGKFVIMSAISLAIFIIAAGGEMMTPTASITQYRNIPGTENHRPQNSEKISIQPILSEFTMLYK